MVRKTAIFICSGCSIDKCIKTGDLQDLVQRLGAGPVTVHPALCSENGLKMYFSTIGENRISSVVVAACSPRSKPGLFETENLVVERVNLRDQVAWIMEPGSEDAAMAASDYLKMGIARIQGSKPLDPYLEEGFSSDLLVVGGGITGIQAALEGASAGYKVHLVEKEDHLGGYAARLAKQIPVGPPWDRLADPIINRKIEALLNHSSIHVYTGTVIQSISGYPGKFGIELSGKHPENLRAGAIVAAMGWIPYDPMNLSFLGYGKNNVVTNVEFEQFVKEKNGEGIPSRVLFIQCAGSRDPENLPYCSSYCCGTSLKQALYVTRNNADSRVYIIYKDIRTPGLQEEFYQAVQKEERVMMTKGEVTEVKRKDDHLEVEVRDSLIDEEIVIDVDLVVLATGMVPAGTSGLNLNYRLGKGLPDLKYDFPDSHFICFPYETRRTGIYAAGAVRGPVDIPSAMEDASGAMFKAIQCIESVKQGVAVHPRSGDKTFPELFMDRCTDCKRCTEECPFGSYDENEKGTPLPNPTRCRRCGICLGSCPERVINFADYSINLVSDMIKAIDVPDEFEEKPRILAFVCENDAYPAFDIASAKQLKYSPFIRIIPVRCLGAINKVWISDALSRGFDGILQIGCKPGDDYQCHFIHGSELTQKRGENIQETLRTMMLEPERIRTEFIEINEYYRIPELVNGYVEEIQRIGPNPFKDM